MNISFATGFGELMAGYPESPATAAPSPARLQKLLVQEYLTPAEFHLLLSPAAESLLEPLAQRARELTLRHFGRTMQLYTPLYLANHCINGCTYCGYRSAQPIERHQLSFDELRREAAVIAATGLRHILVLTGESPRQTTVEYIGECVKILRDYFTSVAIEVYPMQTAEYRHLAEQGADSLTIYQETYDRDRYAELHPYGPKRDYDFRLGAPERGCQAGLRAVNIGALLGLSDPRQDFFRTGLHAHWLQANHPGVEISISLPRIRPVPGGFQPTEIVTDRMLAQFITAFRLFMPRAGITLSTRERAAIRDGMVHLGVTRMSAGSTTAVGGHTGQTKTGQFEIDDTRSVAEIAAMLYQANLHPVFKDWQ
jgi:2-iminoacetate synthase